MKPAETSAGRGFSYRLLWALVLLACLAWAALGRIAGPVPRPVLDDLFAGAARWWSLPVAVHVVALGVLLALAWLPGRRLVRDLRDRLDLLGKPLAVVLVLLGVFICLNQFGELEKVVSRRTDFGTIYQGATALFGGEDPYLATQKQYFYPPLLAFLFGPLLLLPKAGASTLFFTLKFVMMVWTLARCHAWSAGGRLSGRRSALFVFGLVFVASRFWIADLQYGNTNVVILYLTVLAIDLDLRDRPLAAGVALGLAAAIKIVPGVLLLHFALRGRWRAAASFAVTLVVLGLAPWLVLQGHWIDTWSSYFTVGVTGKLGERLAQPDNQSLWGLLNRAFATVPLGALQAVWAVLAAVLAAFAGLASFRARGGDSLRQFAVAAVYPLLGLLVSPGSWVVHYTAVLPAMAVLWALAMRREAAGTWAWPLFALTNFAFTISGWARATVTASTHQSWFVLAALALLIALASWSLRRRTA